MVRNLVKEAVEKLFPMGIYDRIAVIGLILGNYGLSGKWELCQSLGFGQAHQWSDQVEPVVEILDSMSEDEIDKLAETLGALGWINERADQRAGSAKRHVADGGDPKIQTEKLLREGKIQISKAILLSIFLLSLEGDDEPINTEAIRKKLADYNMMPSNLTASLSSLRNRLVIVGEGNQDSGLGFELTEAGRSEVKRLL